MESALKVSVFLILLFHCAIIMFNKALTLILHCEQSPRKDEHIVACSHRRWQAFRYLQITLCFVIYLPYELGSSVLKKTLVELWGCLGD